MPENTPHRCEALVWGRGSHGDGRCSRQASFDVYHPDAPWASENKTMRLCSQHWNAYSFRGWKLLNWSAS